MMSQSLLAGMTVPINISSYITLCVLGNFLCICCRLLTFFKIKYFRNTIRVSNGSDPDQDRHFACPDLGPNCLQRLSADDKNASSKKKDKFNLDYLAF